MDEEQDRRFRLDDETINLGRRELERIRQRLNPNTPIPITEYSDNTTAEPTASAPPPPTNEDAQSARHDFDPQRIAAEMSAAAHRENLERRIEQLEAENTVLRSTLSEFQRTLASLQHVLAASFDPTPTAGDSSDNDR